jgi:N-methylhydantoinase B/oxoprolinase/acetone carboxylase alpha subunit
MSNHVIVQVPGLLDLQVREWESETGERIRAGCGDSDVVKSVGGYGWGVVQNRNCFRYQRNKERVRLRHYVKLHVYLV